MAGDGLPVSSHPHGSKRRRIAVACTSCRYRKTRCNGHRPCCSLCMDLGVECIYEQPVKGSSRPNSSTENDERLSAIEDTLRSLVQHIRPAQDRSSPLLAGSSVLNNRGQQDDSQLSVQPCSNGLNHNEDQPTDGMAAVTVPAGTEDSFFGPSSNIAFMQAVSRAASSALKAYNVSHHSANGSYPLVSRPQSPVTHETTSTPARTEQINPSVVPSEARSIFLMQLYFADTALMYPFFNESEVFEAYYNFSRTGFSTISRSWLCLFNAIFACATYLSVSPTKPTTENLRQGDVFFHRAMALVTGSTLRFTDLPSVQSLLILSQYCQGTQRADEAWTLHGLAVRAAFQLGLHCPPKNDVPPGGRLFDTRRRTWFACLILDRTLSMTFGRPLNISASLGSGGIDSELVLARGANTIGVDDDNSFPDTICFLTETVRLYKILSEILQQIYLDNTSSAIDIPAATMFQNIVNIEADLAKWKSMLPPQLALEPWLGTMPHPIEQTKYQQAFSRLSVVLRLRYLNTRILLHRITLVNMLKVVTTGDSILFPGHGIFLDKVALDSLDICQDCAMEIITIVNTASRTRTLLGAWWFSVYYTFNASLVLFGSLLLGLSRIRQGREALLHERMTNAERLAMLAKHLRKAIPTIDQFNNDTELVRRIRRIMIKSVRVCTTLAQMHGQSYIAVIDALHIPGNGDMTNTSTIYEDHASLARGRINEGVPVAVPRTQDHIVEGDVFNFFAEADADVFGNFGDETGLLNLFA